MLNLEEINQILTKIEGDPTNSPQQDIDNLAKIYLETIEDPAFTDSDEFTGIDERFEAVCEKLNPDGLYTLRDPRHLLTLPVL